MKQFITLALCVSGVLSVSRSAISGTDANIQDVRPRSHADSDVVEELGVVTYSLGVMIANKSYSTHICAALCTYFQAKLVSLQNGRRGVMLMSRAIDTWDRIPHFYVARANLLIEEGLDTHGFENYIEQDYRFALKLGLPTASDAGRITTWFYRRRGPASAKSILLRCIERFPESGALHHSLGYILSECEDRDREAIVEFGKAIQLGFDQNLCLIDRARSFANLSEYDRAKTDLDKVLNQNPREVVALMDRAYVHRMLGRLDEALQDRDLAMKLDPELASIVESDR